MVFAALEPAEGPAEAAELDVELDVHAAKSIKHESAIVR